MQNIPRFRLSAFYFAYLAGLGAFSPYFALYLDDRGLSAVAISVAMSLWYGTRIVSPTVWGQLTLHSARPILWLRIGALATLVTFLGFFLPLGIAGVLAVMAVFAFFYNAIMPQFEAITLSHLAGRTQLYSRLRLWGSVGFILVVASLGPVLDRIGVAWLPWIMVPLFAGIVAAAYANDYGEAPAAATERAPLVSTLKRAGVPVFLGIAFAMQVAHGPYYVFFSLFLDKTGYPASWVGTFWTIGVLAEIVVFWFAGSLLTRVGAASLLKLCLAVAALRFAVTAYFPDVLPVMVLAQVAHAFTFGVFHAACMQRVVELFPSPLIGQGQGLLYGLGSGLGGVAGSLLAGWAWELGGGRAAFLAAALAAAVGFAFAVHADRGRKAASTLA
ncbi:MAG TPA: MFS transporter [Xanthomonadales bacterium]|nr:MFS transporter [Xanthomonadales bacterium]